MSHPSKRKGDAAERELATLLADRLGIDCRRMLGAGRADDIGDLHGLDNWTAEVKNYANLAVGINEGLTDLEREQANAGTTFGVCFVRRRGGRWIAVMDLDAWCAVYRETTA
jgi:Holliday junction resolvase